MSSQLPMILYTSLAGGSHLSSVLATFLEHMGEFYLMPPAY